MSEALYGIESLRFWNEDEIEMREAFQSLIANKFKRKLLSINPAWKFYRMEGPLLTPKNFISDAYDSDDIFITQISKANQPLVLRAETTPSSYAYAKSLKDKFPICVWQVGKSFRVEKSDGATASKLRFNEFYQQEFQCIYSKGTKADYRKYLMDELVLEVSRFTGSPARIVESDRLPAYSESTLDIECIYNGSWKEVASCSIRTDFSEDVLVCEIAIGLDRIVTIAKTFNPVINNE